MSSHSKLPLDSKVPSPRQAVAYVRHTSSLSSPQQGDFSVKPKQPPPPPPPRSPTTSRGSDEGKGARSEGGSSVVEGITHSDENISPDLFISIAQQQESCSSFYSSGGGSDHHHHHHHHRQLSAGGSSASSSLFPSEDEKEPYDDDDDDDSDDGFFSSSIIRVSLPNNDNTALQPSPQPPLASAPAGATPRHSRNRSGTPQSSSSRPLCATIVPSMVSSAGSFDYATLARSPRPLSLPMTTSDLMTLTAGGRGGAKGDTFLIDCSVTTSSSRSTKTPPNTDDGVGQQACDVNKQQQQPQSPSHATRVQQARLRALTVRHSEQDLRKRQWHATMKRQNEAQRRREILEEMPIQQRVASWLVLELVTRSIVLMDTLRKRERPRPRGVMVYPIVALRLRRLLRRIRLSQLAVAKISRPTISTLRNDKILNLFSDAHLAHAIENMRLRYFFANELIISMGMEEDEGYVLVQGSADALMGCTLVFTLQAGMCFGTVGMVSGEPRTATVMAREACVVWVISRRDFNSFDGGDGVGKEELTAALQTVEDLRRSNMLNVYKRQLDASSLAMYPVFHGMSSDFLNEVAKSQCLPVIVKGDSDMMLHLPNQPLSQRSPFLLLRGTVVVYASLNSWRKRTSPNIPFYMQLRMLYDVPRRQKSILSTACRQRYTSASGTHGSLQYTDKSDDIESVLRAGMEKGKLIPQNSSDDDRVELLRVRAPALFNLAPTIQGYHTTLPFWVCAQSDCDVLSLSRDVLRSQDMLELAALRQNSLNMRCDFFKAMSCADLVRVLFCEHMTGNNNSNQQNTEFGVVASALLRGDALENAATMFNDERWVYNAQDVIRFDLESDFQVHIILSGEVENSGHDSTAVSSFPYVWPRISEAWFAGSNHTLRAWTQVEAIRIPRRDIVGWVAQELMRGAMQGPLSSLPTSSAKFDLIRQLVKTLGAAVLQRTHRMPQFHHHQLLSTIGGDADVDMSASVATRRMGASVRQSTVVILPTTQNGTLQAHATCGEEDDSSYRGRGSVGGNTLSSSIRPRGCNILGSSIRQQAPPAVMNTSTAVLSTLEAVSAEAIRMVMRLQLRQGMSTVGGLTGASSGVSANTNSNASSSSTSAHAPPVLSAGRASSPSAPAASQSTRNVTSASPSMLHKRMIQKTKGNNSNSNIDIDFPSPPSQTPLHHARLVQSSSSSVFEAVAISSHPAYGSTGSLRTTRSRPASAAVSTTITSNSSASPIRTAGTVSARLQPSNTMRVEIPNSNHSCTTTDGGAGGEPAVSPSRIHALLKKLNGESEHVYRGF